MIVVNLLKNQNNLRVLDINSEQCLLITNLKQNEVLRVSFIELNGCRVKHVPSMLALSLHGVLGLTTEELSHSKIQRKFVDFSRLIVELLLGLELLDALVATLNKVVIGFTTLPCLDLKINSRLAATSAFLEALVELEGVRARMDVVE